MAEPVITLTADQLHDLVGGMFKIGKDVPLELATSTLFQTAEDLRIASTAAAHSGGENEHDLGNILFSISQRCETMANLCSELRKKAEAVR